MAHPTTPLLNLSRRTFLQGAGWVGGGLLLGYLAAPAPGRAAAAMGDPVGAALGSWIHIGPDGRVTVRVEKSEMGQGIHSTLAALVAEELRVSWARVGVETTSFEGPLRGVMTGASGSIREAWEPLRIAGAGARSLLVAAAAEAWSVPVDECRARDGRVLHPLTGRSEGYGTLVERAAEMPLPETVELVGAGSFELLGRSLPRLDVPDKVRGKAVFGIDVRIPGLLHAAPALGPSPGGEIESASFGAARSAPGVRAVVAIPGGVAVVADHYWQARKGVDLLAPVFDVPDPAVDSDEYSRRLLEALGSPGLPAGGSGDPDAAFAGGGRIFEARYEVPFLAHATMEPMNCTAWFRDGRCELWAPSQAPSQTRQDVARALGLDPQAVTLHLTLMGGGFGRRAETDFAVQAALASRAVERPVKLIWSREDDIRHDRFRPACAAHVRAVVDFDGRPRAFVHHVAGPWADRRLPGWLRSAVAAAERRVGSPLAPEGSLPDFVWWRLPEVVRSGIDWIVAGNAPPFDYAVPHHRLEYSLVENSLPVGWWRSVPASQNAFFVESFIDELAHETGADPVAYRRALLPGRQRAVLDRTAEMAGWERARAEGRSLGIAIFSMAGTTVCQAAEVSVDATGVPVVQRVWCALDCGLALDPDTIRAQVEGSILFGLTAALQGRISVRDGRVEQSNFHDYPLLRLAQAPEIEIAILESRESPGGIGEPATPPIAPAVANALFAATGRRVRTLPLG